MRIKTKSNLHTGKDYIDVLEGGKHEFKVNVHFNAGDYMIFLHDWLVENGWGNPKDQDFREEFYHHKFIQGGLEEIRWWWRLKRNPPEGESSFYRYEMNIDVRIIAMKKTEVMKRGMKFKGNHGDVTTAFEGKLILDKEHRWRNHALLKNFYSLYKNRIIHDEIWAHRTFILKEIHRVMDAVKGYYKLDIVRPEKEDEGTFGFNVDYD